MLSNDYGFRNGEDNTEATRKIEKHHHILENTQDEAGNFYWFFGFKPPRGDQRIATHKFQFLANMGLLPDNDVLSNKLINIYGKRVFDLLHDKSQTVEENKGLRKRIGLKLGVTHEDFDDNKRLDMHLCWNMVQKIRAVQEIDTLLNTTESDFTAQWERVFDSVADKIQAIKNDLCHDLQGLREYTDKKYIDDVYNAETNELRNLELELNDLKERLRSVKTKDQYHRNRIIQEWQRETFRSFNHNFRINQGKSSLYGQALPLPKENVSNSISYNNAEYAIQEHLYQEWKPVTKSQLWLIDKDNSGNVMDSSVYGDSATKRKELLLAACISEELSTNPKYFKYPDRIETQVLRRARNTYQERKAAIQTASLQAKQNKGHYDLESMSNLPGNDKNRAKAGKIYLGENGTYVVRDPNGMVQTGTLKKSDGINPAVLSEYLKVYDNGYKFESVNKFPDKDQMVIGTIYLDANGNYTLRDQGKIRKGYLGFNPKDQEVELDPKRVQAAIIAAISAADKLHSVVDEERLKNIILRVASKAGHIQTKGSTLQSIKDFIVPEETDPETGLELTSKEISRYIRSFQRRETLDENLSSALGEINHIIEDMREDSVSALKNDDSEEKVASTPANTLGFTYSPLPDPASPIREDDALTGALDFVNDFFLFFDKDLMAKRPYMAMMFFCVPFLQIALPILGGSSALMAKASAALFTVEAKLAKYTGLNAFLQATMHKQITEIGLKSATNAVRDAAAWFTCAEGPFEKALVGSLVAKLVFNVADLTFNGPAEKDAALLSEFADTIFPGMTGSLEGSTAKEKFINLGKAILKTSLQLGGAALGVGAIEHYIPGAQMVLGKLATVHLDHVVHPHLHDIRFLQTIGEAKAAAIILLKTFGILNRVNSGQLVDIDGYKLRENSNSHKVLKLFVDLTQCSPEKRAKLRKSFRHEESFTLAREHFQELLSLNPALWEIYKGENGKCDALKELGVMRIAPKRRHKYSMALLKVIPAALKMALGLVPGLLFAVPVLYGSSSPQELLPSWLKPLYKYSIESLNLWVKVLKAAWTPAKATPHPFLAVALRGLEMIPSAIFLSLAIPALILRPVGYLIQKAAGLKNNPMKTASNLIIKGHAVVAGFVREYFRYPIEKFVGKILQTCRDVIVRKIERETQVLTSPKEQNKPPIISGDHYTLLEGDELKSAEAHLNRERESHGRAVDHLQREQKSQEIITEAWTTTVFRKLSKGAVAHPDEDKAEPEAETEAVAVTETRKNNSTFNPLADLRDYKKSPGRNSMFVNASAQSDEKQNLFKPFRKQSMATNL